ncbi:hypothetical protein B0H10DRAFT_176987 [Mycena sp. CBHHK59/15]|nr:hypothetical protein B0H10DRAFT_176987 [Mycena sp. CBHHK59/15]
MVNQQPRRPASVYSLSDVDDPTPECECGSAVHRHYLDSPLLRFRNPGSSLSLQIPPSRTHHQTAPRPPSPALSHRIRLYLHLATPRHPRHRRVGQPHPRAPARRDPLARTLRRAPRGRQHLRPVPAPQRARQEGVGGQSPADLEPPSAGFTLFGGRARAASEARRADTVYAGSAWSRSDAHLRSSVDISGCDEKGDAASVAESVEQGHAQGPETEVEHPDFIIVGAPAFHSESPLQEQDEPALADSRPNTLMAPLSQDITHAL